MLYDPFHRFNHLQIFIVVFLFQVPNTEVRLDLMFSANKMPFFHIFHICKIVLEDIRPYSFYWRNVFICLLNNLLNEHIVFKSWMPIIFSYAYNCLLSWIGQRLITLKFCDHDLCLHNWSWLESLDLVICINYWKFSVITKLAMTL